MRTYGRTLLIMLVLVIMFLPISGARALGQTTPAEDLIALGPHDLWAYVATSGGDSLKPAFTNTILGQMWQDPGVQSFVASLQQVLVVKLAQETDAAQVNAAMDTIQDFTEAVLGRPLLLGIAQKQAQGGPPIYGFAMVDAGARKSEIGAALSKLEALAGLGAVADTQVGSHAMRGPVQAGDLPVSWGWIGQHLVFAVNDSTGLAMQRLQGGAQEGPDYLAKVPGTGDALVMHIDWDRMFKWVQGLVRMQASMRELNVMQAVLSTLGLDGLRRLTMRVGFTGSDVVSHTLLETTQTRSGLLSQCKPIDLALFDMVSPDAMNASAFHLDWAGVYDSVINALRTALGDEALQVEQAITQLEAGLQIKLRQGVLKSLEGPVVFYTTPGGSAAGSLQGAFALVAKLKDRTLWQEALTALEQFAASQSQDMLQISKQDHGGVTVHIWTSAPLAMVSLMPCWAVKGDLVVIASNPTFMRTAVDQVSGLGSSIRRSAGFKQACATLPDNLLSVKYGDSKTQFNQMMMSVQQFWPMVTMGAARAGVKLPPVLPNLSHIAERMTPCCQYVWRDAQGLRSYYRGTGLEPSLGSVTAAAGVGAAVMIPAMIRARESAKHAQSATHLSEIGRALLIYANDHNQAFPSNLDELVQKADVDPGMLESPRKPKGFPGPSYVYIVGQNSAMDPENIVVYENPGYSRDGLNVLYLDSHVAWTTPDDFLRDLQATCRRLGREMPAIEFGNP